MANFLYYLPGASKLPKDTIATDLGLERVLGDVKGFQTCGCEKGPDGGAGVTFRPSGTDTPEAPTLYRPSEQSWFKAENGLYWLGFYNEQRPTPAELERETELRVWPVRLADGNEWNIPVAMYFTEPVLPKVYGADPETGKRIEKDRPGYLEFSKLATAHLECVLEAEGEAAYQYDPDDLYNLAVEAICVQYKLTPFHINALDLLSPQLCMRVAMDTLGEGWIRKILESKKNEELDTSNTECGETDCEDTQAAQMSTSTPLKASA